MPQTLRRPAAQHDRRDAPELDHVIRDQPVATRDQVERHLALADAALTEDQDPQSLHLDQIAVELSLGGEPILEPGGGRADELGRAERRGEHRDVRGFGRLGEDGRRRGPVGDDEAGDAAPGHRRHRSPRPRGIERREIRDLAVAEHLHPVRMQLRQVPGEGQARLLETGYHDRTVEAAPTRDDAQPERWPRRLE